MLQLFSFNWNKNNHKKLMEESEEIPILKKKKSKFQEQVDEETREKWKKEQAELRTKLIVEDDFDW